jgi:hypothetical protein
MDASEDLIVPEATATANDAFGFGEDPLDLAQTAAEGAGALLGQQRKMGAGRKLICLGHRWSHLTLCMQSRLHFLVGDLLSETFLRRGLLCLAARGNQAETPLARCVTGMLAVAAMPLAVTTQSGNAAGEMGDLDAMAVAAMPLITVPSKEVR